MKQIVFIVAVFWLIQSAAVGSVRAAENEPLSAEAAKTVAIVKAAHDFTVRHSDDMNLVQQALVNDPRFSDHDLELYVFIHCYDQSKKEAVCCGQGVRPELLGRNMWGLRTPNGRLLFQELIRLVERDGQGWLEYDWLNPFTGKIQTKRSYVMGIVLQNGRKAWVGSGFWKN